MNYLDATAQRVEHEIALNLRPDERGEDLYRLYGLLVLIKGVDCTLEDVHDAWSAWMTTDQPDHEALVPFEELSREAKEKDRPYLDAIKRAAADRRAAL